MEPGYSAVRDAVSSLGARDAAHPWLIDLGLVIWGTAFITAAMALLLDRARGFRAWLGPSLIAVTGLAQILDGNPFRLDCRPTIDPGCRAHELAGQLSWQHYAHGWIYVIGADALLLSIFAMAWRFRGDARWGRADLLALGAGVFGVAISAVLFFATGDDSHGHYGLVQRLALTAAGLWVAALTVGLLAIYGGPRDSAARFIGWVRTLPGGQLVVRPSSALDLDPARRELDSQR
jgi:Protein of unknown function (DUF998)